MMFLKSRIRKEYCLSVTERRVMELVKKGINIDEIADELGCSITTVKNRIRSNNKKEAGSSVGGL